MEQGVLWLLSLPFILSCLPTAVRFSGTDIILSLRILKSTKAAVITMFIPPDRASEGSVRVNPLEASKVIP
jgi:hypothetical protein